MRECKERHTHLLQQFKVVLKQNRLSEKSQMFHRHNYNTDGENKTADEAQNLQARLDDVNQT